MRTAASEWEAPAQQTFVLMKTSCVFNFKIHLQDVFKTSWSRPIYSSWPYVLRTFSKRFEDVLKTSSRHLQDVFQKCLQNVLQKSSKYFQDVFKTYHQVKLFLLTRLREVFNKFLRHSFPKTVIYRGICLRNTTLEKFIVSVQNLQER